MPKVSVIIPTYNCERFISDAIESVLGQTFKDYEMIVVDDGSTDNTARVLSQFSPKIKYIYQSNGGPAKARNTGILNAQGKYIAFLDADDAWLPDKLKMQVEYLERNNNLGLVYTDVYILNNRRFTASKQGGVRCFQRRPPFRGKVCQELFLDNPIMTSSVLMRKDCFEKTGLFKPLLSPIEDYDIWLRTAVFYEMDFIDIPLVKYRDYTGTFNKNVILTLTNIINTLNGFLTDYPAVANLLGKKAKQRVALHYVMLGKRYLLRADFRKAFYNFNLAQRLTKSIVLPFYIFFSSFFDCLMIIPRYFKNLIYKVMPGIG